MSTSETRRFSFGGFPFGTPPFSKASLPLQRELVKYDLSMKSKLRHHDRWEPVPIAWFNMWKKYVDFDSTSEEDNRSQEEIDALHPGLIDCSSLLGDFGDELNFNLKNDIDFVVLPNATVNEIFKLYGPSYARELSNSVKSASRGRHSCRFPRFVIKDISGGEASLFIELYPMRFELSFFDAETETIYRNFRSPYFFYFHDVKKNLDSLMRLIYDSAENIDYRYKSDLKRNHSRLWLKLKNTGDQFKFITKEDGSNALELFGWKLLDPKVLLENNQDLRKLATEKSCIELMVEFSTKKLEKTSFLRYDHNPDDDEYWPLSNYMNALIQRDRTLLQENGDEIATDKMASSPNPSNKGEKEVEATKDASQTLLPLEYKPNDKPSWNPDMAKTLGFKSQPISSLQYAHSSSKTKMKKISMEKLVGEEDGKYDNDDGVDGDDEHNDGNNIRGISQASTCLRISSLLYDATFHGSTVESLELVDRYLSLGGDINYQSPKRLWYKGNWIYSNTSLHVACIRGLLPIINRLLESNANVNIKNSIYSIPNLNKFVLRESETPICYATTREIGQILIDNGADLSAKSYYGETILHHAARKNNVELARLLLDNRVDPSAKNIFGTSPLHHASKRGHLEIAKFLLDGGADLNDRVTELIKSDDPNLSTGGIEEAFELGGNLNFTALDLAIIFGHYEVTQLLLLRGAATNPTDVHTCLSPLHLAYKFGHVDIMELLINNGADTSHSFVAAIISAYKYENNTDHRKYEAWYAMQMYSKPTNEKLVIMAITMMKELYVYHHFDCSSFIDIWQLMH